MFLSIIHDAENDFKLLVRKITVRILPTRPQILVRVLPVDGPHVRRSAFYPWPSNL